MEATSGDPVTAWTVAQWMVEQVKEEGELYQAAAALRIQELFGEDYVCEDSSGELGIARTVLYRFKKLTEDTVVWTSMPNSYTEGYWRMRIAGDLPGRTQPYYR